MDPIVKDIEMAEAMEEFARDLLPFRKYIPPSASAQITITKNSSS